MMCDVQYFKVTRQIIIFSKLTPFCVIKLRFLVLTFAYVFFHEKYEVHTRDNLFTLLNMLKCLNYTAYIQYTTIPYYNTTYFNAEI